MTTRAVLARWTIAVLARWVIAVLLAVPLAVVPNTGGTGFSDPRTTTQQSDQYGSVSLEMDWAVPPGTRPGDTIAQTLPGSLDELSFQEFDVLDEQGRVIARATLGADADGRPAVVFTFGPAIVLGGDGASGTARFSLRIDRSTLVWNGDRAVIDVYDQQVTVTRSPVTAAVTKKTGDWRPNRSAATATDEDGALRQPDQHMEFAIAFAADTPGSRADDWTTGTITEPPLNGFRPHCRDWGNPAYQVDGFMVQVQTPGASDFVPVPADSTQLRITSVTCPPDGSLTLSFTKPAVDDGAYYRIYYRADLVTDAHGRPVHRAADGSTVVGFAETYRNDAVVTLDGRTWRVDEEVVGQDASGDGSLQNRPAVDIEKYSAPDAWAGVPFDTRGVPAVGPGPDFEPLVQPDGDFDSAPGSPLAIGTAQPIRFTVTNIGSEPLRDLVVTDTTLVGPDLRDASCDFSPFGGPSQGLRSGAAVLPRRGVIQCTAVLPGMPPGADHADRAAVVGVGTVSGGTVTDADPWHAYTDRVPGIDVEKYSGDWDGVVFGGDGIPALGADGQPVPQPGDDFDTGAMVVDGSGPVTVRVTVTNTGSTPLRDVRVADRTIEGDPLSDLRCTFPDRSMGTSWAGPLPVGASFDCIGTLGELGPGDIHEDIVSVTASFTHRDGTVEQVGDEDRWRALAPIVLGPGPSPTSIPSPSSIPTPGAPPLAATGGSLPPALGALGMGLGFLVVGAAALAFARSRPRSARRP